MIAGDNTVSPMVAVPAAFISLKMSVMHIALGGMTDPASSATTFLKMPLLCLDAWTTTTVPQLSSRVHCHVWVRFEDAT